MLRPRQIPVARRPRLPRHWGAIDQDIASGHDSEPTAAEGLKRSASDFRLAHLTLVKGLPAGSTASLGRAMRASTKHMETGATQATGA